MKVTRFALIARYGTASLSVLLLGLLASCINEMGIPTTSSSTAAKYKPVSLQNCDLTLTYSQPPKRVVTMTQSALEVMLALGLEQHIVGTAYQDNSILPEFAAAFAKIRLLAAKYPSREVFLSVEPDFVFTTEESAFDAQTLGSRLELLNIGISSYLLPIECERMELRPEQVTMKNLYQQVREIGRIFGVEDRANQVVADLQSQLQTIQQQLGKVKKRRRIFWYDSENPPLTVGNWGMPNHIIKLAGGENIFNDIQGKEAWVQVNWEDVIARQPDVIVLIDASWSSAEEKRQLLKSNPAFSKLEAVQQDRFIVLDFSYTAPGIRNVAGVRKLAAALYPEQFKE